MKHMNDLPWIGVDLDGTLAHYDAWRGIEHIGEPLWPMVNRIKKWLSENKKVKIFTARVCHGRDANERMLAQIYIQQWLVEKCGLPALEVTNEKDLKMIQLWDDRAVKVVNNTGQTIDECKDLVVLTREQYDSLRRNQE